MDMNELKDLHIAIIGIGYVGLPLALEFGKHWPTVGFDLDEKRISELRNGIDNTLESSAMELADAKLLQFTNNADDLASCNVYIITVPTPIDSYKRPDLTPLREASRNVGSLLSEGDLVIYESTVFPGATEEECVPVLEEVSGLKMNEGFFIGYSPERVNPGDKERRLPSIMKITSGSTPEIGRKVDNIYRKIITAGTHLAPSIKVAEAAKVIENTQRDVNIALVNEFAVMFDLMDIDTLDVLEAAGTKWNFLPFRPGLVGGHCIGVDPYYLASKAQSLGYHPEVMMSGRKVNDGMGAYVANRLIRALIDNDILIKDARILILGLTFKENCPDVRNTRVVDIIAELQQIGCKVDVADPWADANEAKKLIGKELVEPMKENYDAVLVSVAHSAFAEMGLNALSELCSGKPVIMDLKGLFRNADIPPDNRLVAL
ncbi:nucleotide sugar dehydrogenase [Parasphingorhabdus sp.]|uniref:nucleotide sugar dehydrogenase n=1 Tax=Parasphingorhabdus sp. TaxID=2709688 RepID=UPI003A91E901